MFKKAEIKLELLTDIDMFLMVEKGIRGDNKYMKNHNKNKESSYIMYLDVNNLKLPVNNFK